MASSGPPPLPSFGRAGGRHAIGGEDSFGGGNGDFGNGGHGAFHQQHQYTLLVADLPTLGYGNRANKAGRSGARPALQGMKKGAKKGGGDLKDELAAASLKVQLQKKCKQMAKIEQDAAVARQAASDALDRTRVLLETYERDTLARPSHPIMSPLFQPRRCPLSRRGGVLVLTVAHLMRRVLVFPFVPRCFLV